MQWFYLALAGVFEVIWAVSLKYTEGFTKLYFSAITLVAMVFSFLLLSQSLKSLPLGTAYAVWTGIGAVGTTIFGICFFDEPVTFIRLGCILLIIIAIIGLKITSNSS